MTPAQCTDGIYRNESNPSELHAFLPLDFEPVPFTELPEEDQKELNELQEDLWKWGE